MSGEEVQPRAALRGLCPLCLFPLLHKEVPGMLLALQKPTVGWGLEDGVLGKELHWLLQKVRTAQYPPTPRPVTHGQHIRTAIGEQGRGALNPKPLS